MHYRMFKRNVIVMLTVDIKFTIYFCRVSTKISIENDLNLSFNGARRHFHLLWI